MKILVTGGSGYLGTHIRSHFKADDLSLRNGQDILNVEHARAAGAYDVVIHLAASLDRSGVGSENTLNVNVDGTRKLLKAMRKGSTFIFMSTKDIYASVADQYPEVPETCPVDYLGQTAYEWSKYIAEQYVELYANTNEFRSCIFRLSTPYAPPTEGNSPNFVGAIAETMNLGEPIALPGEGSPVRDIIHVDDISAACEAFLDSAVRHGKYNLGGGKKERGLDERTGREDGRGFRAAGDS
ncbi:MAG: nucleoside-diphosphate-sugar epimerase [Acidobacteria bacterium OLB17]|nr:MAG: nucleoside-diphosphate-sugar epimerase [Acidobacteria bacterium OLB17]